jgi:peptide/nickel transport system substrate-binding protein
MSHKRFWVVLLAILIVTSLSITISAQDTEYGEAPMLAEMVAAGELPPVEERLPVNPLVVEPIDSVGVYGGIWNRAWRGINDFHCFGRTTYDPVLRWPRDPADPIQPGLAERWEFNDEGTELTLYFREGLRWSDGEPWTVDDVIFWWEAIENDTNITGAVHTEWQTLEELVKVNDYTITLKFSAPNGMAETVGLAFHGHQWPLGFERFGFYAPEHYLAQFHPAYSDDGSYELFEEKSFDYNPDRPAMTAWKIVEYEAGTTLIIAERNPYYWKVDIEGNQLPYIDYEYFHAVEGSDGVNIMGVAGELDMQARAVSLAQYPVYMENAEAGNYHMLLWSNASAMGVTFFLNQSYADDAYRELFQTLEFRQALSVAIDRNALNDIVFLGQGTPRNQVVVPDARLYIPELEDYYTQYDVELAQQLLDEAGLPVGDDGFRTFPDGSELLLVINSSGEIAGEVDTVELVAEWWNAIGVQTSFEIMTRDIYWPLATSNQAMITTWDQGRALTPMVDPIGLFPFDERAWIAPAYGIWYKTGGEDGLEPPDHFLQAMALYDEYKVTTDSERQKEIGQELVRMSTEGLWGIGTVGLTPGPVIVRNGFMNVPDNHTADWIIMTPGTLDPSHFYFANGGE